MAGWVRKRVKELPTDSPYKPCCNKPLPETSFHWLNWGRAGIYNSVPAIWWWLPHLSTPPPLSHPFIPPAVAVAGLRLSLLLFPLSSLIQVGMISEELLKKKILANSWSSLIPARHCERGSPESFTHTWLGIFIEKCSTEGYMFIPFTPSKNSYFLLASWASCWTPVIGLVLRVCAIFFKICFRRSCNTLEIFLCISKSNTILSP